MQFVALGSGLLVLNIAFVTLLDKLEQADLIRIENIQLQETADRNFKFANELQLIYQEQRILTHDFNNHVSTLSSLLASKQYIKASEYVTELGLFPCVSCVVSTNNPMLDAILNQKYSLAKAQNTSMRFTINNLSSFPMQDVDMVTLLGNLLDNALDACKKVEGNASIHVKIISNGDTVLLYIANTSLPVEITVEQMVCTDKADVMQHGFGLKNVRRILAKNNCAFSIYYENGQFNFTTILS